ncbi:MAG: alginate export family protein [Gemmatimonadota bacterium]|jgi:hypothetical protein
MSEKHGTFMATDCHMVERPRRTFRLLWLALCLTALPANTTGQTLDSNRPDLTWGGEIRPRFLGREPVEGGWDSWISMRSRVALDGRWESGLGFFVQVQDVRFWGEETSNRDRSADAVDFHQAYLEVDDIPGIGGRIRGGRQEVSLGEGRFISAPDWGQAGQSFDGLLWTRFFGSGNLDVLYLRTREGSSDTHESSADFAAVFFQEPLGSQGSLRLLAIHDRSTEDSGTHQTTLGPTWTWGNGRLSLRAQGMLQFGERDGRDVSAHMLAASTGLQVLDGRGSVTLWYDRLSGDSDPENPDQEAFSTLFGARHRYYGRADYFLNIPEDTGDLGLEDAALKLAFRPHPRLGINLDLHRFRTTEAGEFPGRHLGEEVDLWISYLFRGALRLEAGYSVIRAGKALEELDRLEGTGNMAYLMSSLRF